MLSIIATLDLGIKQVQKWKSNLMSNKTGQAEGRNWQIDGDEFIVLINAEDQHSLWPSATPIPTGWERIGPMGTKAQCLEFIDKNWTDMRPRSLREAMARSVN